MALENKDVDKAMAKLDSSNLKEIKDWEKLWNNGIFPWHKGDVHPKLERYLQDMIQATGKTLKSEIRFFVPLCGKSMDLMFLKSQGFRVIGCECAEKAITDFFKENSLEFSKTEINDEVSRFDSIDGQVSLIQGDYFKMTPEMLEGKVDCVWDRGSFVAIDVAKRPEYAKVMMSLINDKFAYLIASLEREVEPDNPMPHSASFDDIEKLFGKKMNVDLIEQKVLENKTKDNTFLITPNN